MFLREHHNGLRINANFLGKWVYQEIFGEVNLGFDVWLISRGLGRFCPAGPLGRCPPDALAKTRKQSTEPRNSPERASHIYRVECHVRSVITRQRILNGRPPGPSTTWTFSPSLLPQFRGQRSAGESFFQRASAAAITDAKPNDGTRGCGGGVAGKGEEPGESMNSRRGNTVEPKKPRIDTNLHELEIENQRLVDKASLTHWMKWPFSRIL